MIRDPQQVFFTRLRVEIEKKYPGRVYDGHLPPDGTQYPFIYLADSMSVDVSTKSGYIARITQTIRQKCFTRSRRLPEELNLSMK